MAIKVGDEVIFIESKDRLGLAMRKYVGEKAVVLYIFEGDFSRRQMYGVKFVHSQQERLCYSSRFIAAEKAFNILYETQRRI